MHRGKLGIISDTPVCKNSHGLHIGYEPVVKEIEYFLKEWNNIEWLAYSRLPEYTVYSNPLPPNVRVKAIKPVEGRNFISRIIVAYKYLKLFIEVFKVMKKAQDIHVRAPSHPALCAMLLAPFFTNKTIWFKYAGSWVEKASISYRLQRYLLKKISQKKIFTSINGEWPNTNSNILNLENPCFSKRVYEDGKMILFNENLKKLKLIYVGSLSEFKGVHLVMKALIDIKFKGIDNFTIIGSGDYERDLKTIAENSTYAHKFKFEGKKNKNEVFQFLQESDLLIIASKTEGFPKVISEAMMNYCIPISTRVSCIDQYIDNETGFLIEKRTVNEIKRTLSLVINDEKLFKKKINCRKKAEFFTYERYLLKIKNHILK